MDKRLAGIEQLELKDKKVFIRCDLNVPIENGKILNNHRLLNALPTIRYALDQKARVTLASHLGRPEGKDLKLSLAPAAGALGEVLDVDVFFVEDFFGDARSVLSPSLKENQLLFLENLRFHPGEKKNSEEFASLLAQNIDVYINDAFGVCHRQHASLSALPKKIEKKGIGFLIQKEMEMLDRLRLNPRRPFTAVLGGAKVKDKLELIFSLMDHADHLVIGGKMAYCFLKAQGHGLGTTAIEDEDLSAAREITKRAQGRGKQLYLPLDHIISPAVEKTHLCRESQGPDVPEGFTAFDIGPQTRKYFQSALRSAHTIFWNGPMGVFEVPPYSEGTKSIAQAIGRCSSAFKIVGGGDSARAVHHYRMKDLFDHVSTGGGAAMAYIQGKTLSGIENLYTPCPEEGKISAL